MKVALSGSSNITVNINPKSTGVEIAIEDGRDYRTVSGAILVAKLSHEFALFHSVRMPTRRWILTAGQILFFGDHEGCNVKWGDDDNLNIEGASKT